MQTRGRIDFVLLITTLALVGIGIVMVYSTSAIIAGDRFGDPYYFLKRQALYAGVGFALMILMMFFPYDLLKRLAYPIFILSILLLMAVLIPGMGYRAGGTTRWLKIGGFTFQPSEFSTKDAGKAVEIINVSDHQPRRIPSAKWRELIKKVWEADPLLCPKCQREMRIVALIDDRGVIERILRHLGLWQQGVRVTPARAPPEVAGRVIPPSPVGYGGQAEPWLDDPFPDYDTEPVMMYANG